jgi:hypothetical protein
MRAHELTESGQPPEHILQNQDAMAAADLAITRGRRWPAAEEFIIQNFAQAWRYNWYVMNDQWTEFHTLVSESVASFDEYYQSKVESLASTITQTLEAASHVSQHRSGRPSMAISDAFTSSEDAARIREQVIRDLQHLPYLDTDEPWSWLTDLLTEAGSPSYITEQMFERISLWWLEGFTDDYLAAALGTNPRDDAFVQLMYTSDVIPMNVQAIRPVLMVMKSHLFQRFKRLA